jgi:hypothetical protein
MGRGTPARDAGYLVSGWVIKLTLFLAVVGVAGFDVISIVAGHINAEDDAQSAATAASSTWSSTHNVQQAYAAAVASITTSGEKVLTKDFSIDADGTVHLLVQRHIHTIVVGEVGPLRHFTQTVQHGDADADAS